MKLLLVSLLLLYAVHSLPRFSRPLGDLEDYVADDDDDGDYDGGFEIGDDSDDDDDNSFFENGKSRKSNGGIGRRGFWDELVNDGYKYGSWGLGPRGTLSEEEERKATEMIEKAGKIVVETIKKNTQKGDSTENPSQDASRQFQKSNARKISVNDFDTHPPPPPFFPNDPIDLEDDDEYLISEDNLHTPEDLIPISDPIWSTWRENRRPGPSKPKSQQSKSARRVGYVRKGWMDDFLAALPELPIVIRN